MAVPIFRQADYDGTPKRCGNVEVPLGEVIAVVFLQAVDFLIVLEEDMRVKFPFWSVATRFG